MRPSWRRMAYSASPHVSPSLVDAWRTCHTVSATVGGADYGVHHSKRTATRHHSLGIYSVVASSTLWVCSWGGSRSWTIMVMQGQRLTAQSCNDFFNSQRLVAIRINAHVHRPANARNVPVGMTKQMKRPFARLGPCAMGIMG